MTVLYERAPAVLWRRTLRGLIVRPLAGTTTLVSGSANLVWDALSQPRTAEELSSLLAEVTGESAQVIAADLQPLLETLSELGVLESP